MPGTPKVLEILLGGLFDYAGMFPPASLSFNEALINSLAFPRELKHPFLVGGNLVLGTEHLARLTDEVFEGTESRDRSYSVCLLGSPIQSEGTALTPVRNDELAKIKAFNREGKISTYHRHITSYEMKLAPTLQQDHHQLTKIARGIQADLSAEELMIFLEPDLSVGNWESILESIAGVISMLNEDSDGPRLGLKIRCSGPASLTSTKLAHVVTTIASSQLHFKATAGLHHPIVERARYQNEFGFLNLVSAIYLKRFYGSNLELNDVLSCLTCDDKADFELSTGLRWKKRFLSYDDLLNLKESFHLSIGSCSLSEPDQDLLRLF